MPDAAKPPPTPPVPVSPKGYPNKYGFETEKAYNPLELELFCYRHWHVLSEKRGLKTEWTHHFREVVNMVWGPKNKVKSVEWNPWLELELEACHYHPVTGEPYPHTALNGCASSGKTLYMALHGLINWWCDPFNTMVLCTSTDLKASRKRIWGEIMKLWQAAGDLLPGKMIESQCQIATYDRHGKKLPDTAGVSLIAGEKRKEKEAVGKIIGAKNKRVFFLGDEMPELTHAILEAAMNLMTNENFQLIAGGNFKSRVDAFGVFVAPVDGWESLTLETTAWLTLYGHCVRFDGMLSPNIVGGEDKWKGIYSSKHLERHRKFWNEHQSQFWRMCRSFEPPTGDNDCIYSESHFLAGKARERTLWLGDRVKISALDPAFTNGGDRSVQHFFYFGQDTSGKQVLELYKTEILREDARKKDQTRNFQIAEQFIANCKAEGVSPSNAAIDSTAAGGVFCDIVCELWKDDLGQVIGQRLFRVDFSGSPTETMVSQGDERTAADKYDRRVTEIWYVGVELMKYGQLKGLTEEVIREMKARNYDTVKGADGLKERVERKDDMKDRLGFSPDEADAYFIGIDLARQRHQFLAAGGYGTSSVQTKRDWKKFALAADSVYVPDEDEFGMPVLQDAEAGFDFQ